MWKSENRKELRFHIFFEAVQLQIESSQDEENAAHKRNIYSSFHAANVYTHHIFFL